MGGQNIGDLLNAAGVTWGFFEGGFDLTITNPNGTTGCNRTTLRLITDYEQGGLHSAPPAVPVLRFHGESDSIPARPRCDDRTAG